MSLTKRWREDDCLSHLVLSHELRQATVSLSLSVGQKTIMHKQKKPIPIVAKWLVGAPLTLCVIALIAYVYNFYGYTISDSVEQWGQTGDYFGGILNPVFATASLLAVSYTLVQQFRESSATAASQAKQAFEQLLFELLRQHRHNLEAIDLYQSSTGRITRGRDCIVAFLKWIKSNHEELGINMSGS